MKPKRYTHRITRRERAALDLLYSPVKTVDGGGTYAVYMNEQGQFVEVDPATIKAEIAATASTKTPSGPLPESI